MARLIEFEWRSDRYGQALELRDRLLRAPLGLDFSQEDLHAERNDYHFGMLDGDDSLIACVVAVPLDPLHVKLRQMAVDTPHQRRGVGSAMLRRVERVLRERGYRRVELNARDTAAAFYQRLGYEPVGEPFEEVTIPHRRMIKSLVVE